jgi:hypothetical protein
VAGCTELDQPLAAPVAPCESRPDVDAERCLNCDAELRGPYCHRCGQRAAPLRVSFVELVGSALKETFSADGRLARSLLPFLFRPGFLVGEYLAGRRVRYSSPVRLFLLALVLGFLAFRLATPAGGALSIGPGGVHIVWGEPDGPPASPPDGDVAAAESGGGGAPGDDLVEALFGDAFDLLRRLPPRDAARLLGDELFDAAPTVLTLLVPLVALVTKLLFPRRLYVEHLILALNLSALAIVLLAIAALVAQPAAALLAFAAIELHVLVALRRVFGAGWPRAIASTVVLAVAHLALFAVGLVLALAAALASL